MCHAGLRYEPVITGHTVLTRAVTNVLPQAGLSCYQGVTSVCALWTIQLGVSRETHPMETTTMETRTFWPDTQDQAICASFLHDFPVEGYGLCYLFGALRGSGCSREVARALALEGLPLRQEGEGGTLPR